MKKFKVGDTVKVINKGESYELFEEMFEEMYFNNKKKNPCPKNGTVGQVFETKPHPYHSGIQLYAVVTSEGKQFIVNQKGIELVHSYRDTTKKPKVMPVKKSIYEQLSVTFTDKYKPQPGDVFKVTRKPSDAEIEMFGWQNVWVDDAMNDAVGKEMVFRFADKMMGVKFEGDNAHLSYPVFVLEFVRRGIKPRKMKLTDSYEAVVYPHKIEVGCQTITKEKFLELYENFMEMQP